MVARYTYLFADLRTGQILNELPLYGVSFSRELGKFGDWTGTIGYNNESIPNADIAGATMPGRTGLFVDRDGSIVYAGVVWTRTYNSDGQTLQMTGQDLSSYFAKRFISANFPTRTFTQVDQLTIAQSLLNQAQSLVGGSIGVVVPSNTSGVLRDREYKANELKPVAEAIQQLSDVINGFDWEIDAQYDTNYNIVKTARFGYPFLGKDAQSTGLLWEFPGSITEYWWSESASDGATSSWAVGAGDGDAQVIAVAEDPDLISAGYPILERSTAYSDVSVFDTLQEHAQSDLHNLPVPVLGPTINVRADIEPVFGSYELGDHTIFEITDPFFAQKFRFIRRITGWRLTPPGENQDELVDLTTAVAYGS